MGRWWLLYYLHLLPRNYGLFLSILSHFAFWINQCCNMSNLLSDFASIMFSLDFLMLESFRSMRTLCYDLYHKAVHEEISLFKMVLCWVVCSERIKFIIVLLWFIFIHIILFLFWVNRLQQKNHFKLVLLTF